jgi:hypothetical protein
MINLRTQSFTQPVLPRFGQLIPVTIPETGLSSFERTTLELYQQAWQTPEIASFVQEAEARGFDVVPAFKQGVNNFQFSAKLVERPGEPKCQYKTSANDFNWVSSLDSAGPVRASVAGLMSSLRRNLSDILRFDERGFTPSDLVA